MEENVEFKSRVEELEKNRTDSDAENVELRARVMKLEQKQTQNDTVHVLEVSILQEASFNISSNIHAPKLSENKEIDEFLDLKSKERVSSEIKQRNRKKKLQCESAEDRSQNLVLDTSISPEQNHVRGKEKCQEISVTGKKTYQILI